MDIKNLTFSYGTEDFIKNINTTIEMGKITTIIGPNGSGKSTLLNLVVKQLMPKSGEVILDGKNLSTCSYKSLAKQLAIVHQYNQAPSDLRLSSWCHMDDVHIKAFSPPIKKRIKKSYVGH